MVDHAIFIGQKRGSTVNVLFKYIVYLYNRGKKAVCKQNTINVCVNINILIGDLMEVI